MWKNGAPAGKTISTLAYDQDLGFFKVMAAGNIWLSFNANQVQGCQTSVSGMLVKKHQVAVSVKFQNGDEYMMSFASPSQEASVAAKSWIDNLTRIGLARAEVLRLLKVHEKVGMAEVGRVLAKHSLSDSTPESVSMVEGLIASGNIDGVVEGETFMSRLAKQRETVNYQVVTSFDVANNGMISLKCPNCGSPAIMKDASQTRKCEYCGTEFMVPKRILDML